MLAGERRAERDEVRDDGEQVDEVHDVAEEAEVVGRRGEPRQKLEREPDDADGLDDEERLVEVHRVLLRHHRPVGGDVHHMVTLQSFNQPARLPRQRRYAQGGI